MNTNNFKIFIEALEALPQDIKDREVDINGFKHFYNKPTAKSKTNDAFAVSRVSNSCQVLSSI
jgi:hypothetical protein